MKRIEILHVTASLDSGGVETLLANFYEYIDKQRFHWTIITMVGRNHNIGIAEKRLRALGADVFYMPRKVPYFFQQLYVFDKFIKKNKFDVIHAHVDEFNAFYLLIAKYRGIKHRISHCHIAHTRRGTIFELLSFIVKPILKISLTDKMACSKDAACFLYGKDSDTYIMRNAIEFSRFHFCEERRLCVREKYNLSNKLVMGCVARFDFQKNHEFLIDIFYEFHRIVDNAYLLLVGNGKLECEIRKKVSGLGLEKYVYFVGTTDNVGDFLCAMDCFVLPSRYEGLGIVYIESQAEGLPTFATLESVPHEVAITDRMYFISKMNNPAEWAMQISNILKDVAYRDRDVPLSVLKSSGYELQTAVEELEKEYARIINSY